MRLRPVFLCLLGTVALGAFSAGARGQTGPEAGVRYTVSGWTYGDVTSLGNALQSGSLDEMDLDWFVSKRNGELGGDDWNPELMSTAQAGGATVLATVTNWNGAAHGFDPAVVHAILHSRRKTQRHIRALVQLCIDHGYDGLDLDWESLKAKDRDRFSAFVEDLAAALHHQGLILAIAVHPKTSEPGDWSGAMAEDWARLGAAVDEFKVMTYDYSWAGTAPGPIAPPDWMDAVIAHAESLVPPEKIMMGLPFYGYDWSGGTARGLNWSDVQAIIAAYAPDVRRDASGEATFAYSDGTGARHTVFFEDSQALQVKLDMMLEKHPAIRGAAIWIMQKEDPGFWDVVGSSLKPG